MEPRTRPEVGQLWFMELENPRTGLEKELLVYLVEDLSDDYEEPTFWVQIGRDEHALDNNPLEKAMTETMILERCYLPRR